ncbi:MAG: 2,3,4,5-tetrahydropyridine-2,6-dicarboxylate N-succinyltransferase, partial [Actinobacteria bacterium]|nr:2,3,4,5-tetrahydropyridine-2,6-dicarboxylate N-succinyltransferase [Actinomycetota bacterium]
MTSALAAEVERVWESGELDGATAAVDEAIRLLDTGELRVAERGDEGWVVNEWVKKAILLLFRLREMEPIEVGPFEYLDKIPLKSGYERQHVRVVPPAV